MKKYFAPTLLLAFLSLPAIAASPKPETVRLNESDIVVPVDSPVHYSGPEKRYNKDVATFKGRFLLTGTYYYGDNDFNDSGDDNPANYRFVPEAYIIPDDDVAARLPRFVTPKWAQTIFISNPATFANAAISKALARRVRCRHCGDATGHIAIWVDQFSAGTSCGGAPSYEARFLSVYKPAPVALLPRPERAC
jgi:hypothetical protein